MKHYHLIGIGGIGMSGIAQLLLSSGEKVSGSDLKENRNTKELERLGAKIFIGHFPGNVFGADLVVYSSAIDSSNPEILEAERLNIPLIKRAQALNQLMADKTVITVAGSHGKTTTTSLVSLLLLEAGLKPTVAIGGILRNIGTNACFGQGCFFVAEADESDGSFLYYKPNYSIITNIDHEHLDFYKEFKNELSAFGQFLNNTEPDGCLYCCADDINLKELVKPYKNRCVLFGLSESADIYPKNIRANGLNSEFECIYKGKSVDKFKLSLGGMHNISNALSVIALGLDLGIDLSVIKNVLTQYKGAGRRLEIKLDSKKYLLIDDYAHHPTEIKATLSAVKNLKRNRVIAIFQPHRYSRTKLLLEEFSRSFGLTDELIITDIYPASELPIEGINAGALVDKIKENAAEKEVIYLPKDQIVKTVLKMIRPGDVIITLGAGDIVKVNDELVEVLKNTSEL